MQTIPVEIIETILKKLFANLQSRGISRIPLTEDFYWHVPVESMADLSKKPELEVGSLKDDIEFLKSLVEQDYDTDYLELERLASVLRFAGKELEK